MYYQNYEDYMRQVLGYPTCDPRIYESYNYRDDQDYEDTYYFRNQETSSLSDEEIRGLYPDIYNLAYPMVCKVCETNTQPITKDLIEEMTDEVYNAIEASSTVVNVRVDAPIHESKEEAKTNSINTSARKDSRRDIGRNYRDNTVKAARLEDTRTPKSNLERKLTPVSDSKIVNTEKSKTENRTNSVDNVRDYKETRQHNSSLRDLIKILLLFRLFGNRPGRPRPPRPPFPGGPGRPPFPGGPGSGRPPMGPGGRPPIIQPRDYLY